MKKQILATMLALLAIATTAGAQVEINDTNFPDENFRNYVKKFDTDKDNSLSPTEIAKVTEIDVENQSISSLKGIEHFTAVKELFCRTIGLTELDVTKNTELTYLGCGGNQIAKLDLSKNTKLENLHCGHNKVLTELDVSMLPNLWRLYCRENQLKTLDVSKNSELTDLNCGENLLEKLDVSKNTKLQKLYSFDNPLTTLNVSNNTELVGLGCSRNQLTELDLSKNTELVWLICDRNQLTELDLSNNKKLLELYIYGNQIKGDKMLALVNDLPTVTEEYLAENYYTEAPFYAIDTEDKNEQNVITKSQVKIATDKNWKVYSYHYDESTYDEQIQEYEGSDDTTDIDSSLNDNGKMTNENYYSVDGVKLQGEPTKKGVYIIKGKKVKK